MVIYITFSVNYETMFYSCSRDNASQNPHINIRKVVVLNKINSFSFPLKTETPAVNPAEQVQDVILFTQSTSLGHC